MTFRAIQAIVRGQVQGVGFRAFVCREAERLGLRGYTRNQEDGSVEVVAAGDPEAVERLITRLHVGPPASDVEGVRYHDLDPIPVFDRFEWRP